VLLLLLPTAIVYSLLLIAIKWQGYWARSRCVLACPESYPDQAGDLHGTSTAASPYSAGRGPLQQTTTIPSTFELDRGFASLANGISNSAICASLLRVGDSVSSSLAARLRLGTFLGTRKIGMTDTQNRDKKLYVGWTSIEIFYYLACFYIFQCLSLSCSSVS